MENPTQSARERGLLLGLSYHTSCLLPHLNTTHFQAHTQTHTHTHTSATQAHQQQHTRTHPHTPHKQTHTHTHTHTDMHTHSRSMRSLIVTHLVRVMDVC